MGEERLEDTVPHLLTTVVTSLDNQLRKTSDTTRATLKIAFRQHYAGIVRTETNDEKYDWKQTFLNTLQSIRTRQHWRAAVHMHGGTGEGGRAQWAR